MKFPAILIGKDWSIVVIDGPINSCSWEGFKNGYFNDLLIYDSNGESWKVAEVVMKRKPGLIDRMLNRKLLLDLCFDGPENIYIGDIAEKLCECVDNDSDDLYCQFIEHDVLKSLFHSANNPSTLISHARNLGS